MLSEAKDERSECKQARHALERQLSKAKGRETRLKAKLYDQNRKVEARCTEAELHVRMPVHGVSPAMAAPNMG